jgi:hypothetical protein
LLNGDLAIVVLFHLCVLVIPSILSSVIREPVLCIRDDTIRDGVSSTGWFYPKGFVVPLSAPYEDVVPEVDGC